MLKRDIYMPLGGHGQCTSVGVTYVGGGLVREETWCLLDEDDAPKQPLRRRSPDNGRTWEFPIALSEETAFDRPDGGVLHHPSKVWDPAADRTLVFDMIREWPGVPLYTMNWQTMEHPFVDHCFVDSGEGPVLMRYEDGDDRDPDSPFKRGYLDANRAYYGNPLLLPDGRGFFPMVCYRQAKGYSFNAGGLVLMRRESVDAPWLPSNQVYIDPAVSSRGLLEPDVTVLADGRVLVVCRGSNQRLDPAQAPGRKWASVSTNGGRTISEVQPLHYDDGSLFYSPSSIHRFFRSSRTGKLYWLANITPGPTHGNGPRYPLQLCEIDESMPAVKRDGVILVDDRQADEPESVQLSNFSIIEDRETLDIEIYLTRLGETPGNTWDAKPYRYLFSPK
jgi:hypothetical protein